MTLQLRRTCRCGHARALHGAPRHAPCGACRCTAYAGGLVVVLSVRAKEPAARVVVPDEVPDAPAPYVRPAHTAGTGGVPRWDDDELPAPRSLPVPQPSAVRLHVPPRAPARPSREPEPVQG
ncbi:MAG: hypothetical protein ACXVGH_05035 [Mycobacteriales bacterium]